MICCVGCVLLDFFFSSRRRHTRFDCDWSSDVCSSDLLRPRIAILDETDSGLDIDALKIVAAGVKELVGPEMGALLITHYQRILNYIKPDFVHGFVSGRIVEEGGPELAHQLAAEGYEAFTP